MTRLALILVLAAAPPLAAAQRPNVVLFFIDTLRADHVHAYGYGRPTTPNFDRAAARGTLFEQAIAQSSWSLPSYSSIFTSLYPPAHNTNDTNQMLAPELPRVAESFSTYGYDTAAFVGGGHLSAIFGMAKGFDTYRDKPHYGSLFHTVPEAIDWLEQPRQKPFFLMIQGYDAHLPYQVPLGFSELYDPGYRGMVHDLAILKSENAKRITNNVYHFAGVPAGHAGTAVVEVLPAAENEDDTVPLKTRPSEAPLGAKDRAHIVAHYDGAVTYADTWLGFFLSALESRGHASNTIVVMAGDHGEALGEKGFYGHRWDLLDCQIHVPLAILGPGIARGRRVGQIVELVDLAPTLLELCSIPAPHGMQGVSLAPRLSGTAPAAPASERTAYSWASATASARTTRWHLLRFGDGRTELYDISRDPSEKTNVAAANASVRDRLVSQLLDCYERTHRSSGGPEAALSPEEREMFRRLGYW